MSFVKMSKTKQEKIDIALNKVKEAIKEYNNLTKDLNYPSRIAYMLADYSNEINIDEIDLNNPPRYYGKINAPEVEKGWFASMYCGDVY